MMKTTKQGLNKRAVQAVVGGILCAGWVAFATWYALNFNGGRLVYPTDTAAFVLQPKDLPMVLAGVFVLAYAAWLIVLLARAILKNSKTARSSRTTRRLNPKLGFLGLLGLLGLTGFWTYRVDGSAFPFVFFIFFGFFGFFYEGKMSCTFMDERYTENRARAQTAALKIAFAVMVLALVVLSRGRFAYTGIAAMILLAIGVALEIFLSEYLLYRYDHDGQQALNGEGEG